MSKAVEGLGVRKKRQEKSKKKSTDNFLLLLLLFLLLLSAKPLHTTRLTTLRPLPCGGPPSPPAPPTLHNVVGKHHNPRRFLSQPVCQPVHHPSLRWWCWKGDRSVAGVESPQSRSLMSDDFHQDQTKQTTKTCSMVA